MAGGMDWFRWHHGSVNDPKFRLVAARSGASVAEVIAVWAGLLEAASMAERRGCAGVPDFEATECALGIENGKAKAIYEAMSARGLVTPDGGVTAWEKRQPKRERERDDDSTHRVQAHRARKLLLEAPEHTPDPASGNARETPSSASNALETPRGEEKREEEGLSVASQPRRRRKAGDPTPIDQASSVPCPYDAIVEAYHVALPSLPRVRLMPVKRRAALLKLWCWVLTSKKSDGTRRAESADEALDWMRTYFARASDNNFIMGRGARSAEHAGWQCDIDFLLSEKGMKQVIEKTEAAA